MFTHQPDSEPEGLRRVLCKALLRLQVVLLFFVCLWQAALVEMLTNAPSPFVSLGPSVGHSWQQGASRVLKFGGKAIGSISFSTAARLVYLRRRVGDSTPVEEIQFTLSGSPKCRPLRIQVGAPAVEVLSPADAMTSFVDQVVLDPGAAGQLVRQVAWLTGLHVAVAVDGGGGDSSGGGGGGGDSSLSASGDSSLSASGGGGGGDAGTNHPATVSVTRSDCGSFSLFEFELAPTTSGVVAGRYCKRANPTHTCGHGVACACCGPVPRARGNSQARHSHPLSPAICSA